MTKTRYIATHSGLLLIPAQDVDIVMQVVLAPDAKSLKQLGKDLSAYKNTQVVILRGVGIQKIEDYKFPQLLYADLTGLCYLLPYRLLRS